MPPNNYYFCVDDGFTKCKSRLHIRLMLIMPSISFIFIAFVRKGCFGDALLPTTAFAPVLVQASSQPQLVAVQIETDSFVGFKCNLCQCVHSTTAFLHCQSWSTPALEASVEALRLAYLGYQETEASNVNAP